MSFNSTFCISINNLTILLLHLERITLQVYHHIAEHHPVLSSEGQFSVIRSSIPHHLVDTGYQTDLIEAFKITHYLPLNLSCNLLIILFHTTEIIQIHIHKLNLVLKRRLYNLSQHRNTLQLILDRLYSLKKFVISFIIFFFRTFSMGPVIALGALRMELH